MEGWLGLRHVALNVTDVRRAVEFYQDVLGMKLEWRPDADNAYLTSGQDNLALHRVPEPAEPNRGFQALDHIGFLVRRPEDVDKWAQRIQSRGLPLEQPVKTHRDGARSFYLKDPEGNRIQIIYHPPVSGPSADAHSPDADVL